MNNTASREACYLKKKFYAVVFTNSFELQNDCFAYIFITAAC